MARCEIEQRLPGFLGQARKKFEQAIFIDTAHEVDETFRYADAEEILRRLACQKPWPYGLLLDNPDFLPDDFFEFDNLRSPGHRVHFKAPSLCPLVSVVMVADVTEERPRSFLQNDDPKIEAGADSPEPLVAGAVDAMKRKSRSASRALARLLSAGRDSD